MPAKIYALPPMPRGLLAAMTLALAVAVPLSAGAMNDQANYRPAENSLASAHDEAQRAPRHDLIQGAHVEGHIAFLKAELGITPAQESLWMPVAAAMRQDVANLESAEDQAASRMNGSENAVQYLHNSALFARLRADGEARFIAAFEPLYEKLSDAQRAVADELLIPRDR